MIFKEETDFSHHIKNQPLCRVYLLYGQQDYLIRLYRQKICAKAVDKALADFNLVKLDGRKAGPDEISDAVEALPVLSQRRCVVVEDLDVCKLTAAENGKWKELLADPPATAVLLLVASEFDPKKNPKCKNFLKLVDAVGGVMELGDRKGQDLVRFLKAHGEKLGCDISTETCNRLIQRCSTDMQVLYNEICKLCAYKGGQGEITPADVDKCCPAALDANVFDLSRNLLRGDYQAAMEGLNELFYLREEPVAILSVLSGSFLDLYRAKIAREASKTVEDVVKLFPSTYRGREFRLKNAFRDCNKFTRSQLCSMLDLLLHADYRLKSTKIDGTIILQETVTRLYALCRTR